jgi:hypothetical protein
MLDVLRENLPAVDNHVEGTPASRRYGRFEPELARDGGRQTGGLGTIVSTNAIFDGYLHTAIISIGGGWGLGARGSVDRSPAPEGSDFPSPEPPHPLHPFLFYRAGFYN